MGRRRFPRIEAGHVSPWSRGIHTHDERWRALELEILDFTGQNLRFDLKQILVTTNCSIGKEEINALWATTNFLPLR